MFSKYTFLHCGCIGLKLCPPPRLLACRTWLRVLCSSDFSHRRSALEAGRESRRQSRSLKWFSIARSDAIGPRCVQMRDVVVPIVELATKYVQIPVCGYRLIAQFGSAVVPL
uniref:Uncharacterized protein n=1 Tax=Chrysotila carterae TaxID=13221 RepID=A0A7S4BFA0_CHRCT